MNGKANEMKDEYYLNKLRELTRENARELDRMDRWERAFYVVFLTAFVVLLVIGALSR